MNDNFDVFENNKKTQDYIAGRTIQEVFQDNCNEVVNSFVRESKFNKGLFVLVVICRNGKKYIVSGNHHNPTYLEKYEESSDING